MLRKGNKNSNKPFQLYCKHCNTVARTSLGNESDGYGRLSNILIAMQENLAKLSDALSVKAEHFGWFCSVVIFWKELLKGLRVISNHHILVAAGSLLTAGTALLPRVDEDLRKIYDWKERLAVMCNFKMISWMCLYGWFWNYQIWIWNKYQRSWLNKLLI